MALKRAFAAATVYFLALFSLGFVLGTIRVVVVAPRVGALGATLLEMPSMLAAAFFLCRWAVRSRQVSPALRARWVMALWFLLLFALFETLLGFALFGRTLSGTWAGLGTAAGLIGLTGQIIAALLPLFVGRNAQR
ncbi:MAG: hypothetical protein IT554_00825 [Sphingomonadaceae bacterium]|jgi:hypothetical protein|nr:hypothetical protein [Sphingobium sp.]MBP9158674.1 hypothetical protein [Sphingobium sp.]MCC6480942.1 hypothetical protein [Sphingomonadaceae bacterium]